MFFGGSIDGAKKVGRFSADYALNGVYKIFIKMGTPSFIIKRASRILPTYYRPSTMKSLKTTAKSTTLEITEFPKMDQYIEERIYGWIQRALEISGCKGLIVLTSKSFTRGDDITEFQISWK